MPEPTEPSTLDKSENASGNAAENIYCLACQARLPTLGPEKCFHCGHPFERQNAATFLTARQRRAWRFWLPGSIAAVVSGVIAYGLLLHFGEMGWALFFAVPVSFGAILGYGTNVSKSMLGVYVFAVLSSVVLSIYMLHFAGLFCGCTLWLIFLIPMCVGVAIGLLVRYRMRSKTWDQRWFFPIVAFASLPYGTQWLEMQLPHRTEIATVQTELTIDATPREAWNAIMMYEDVRHSPPWLLKLALPKPIRSEGDKRREGEVVRCFYDRGILSKRICRVEPERTLAFEVVEQQLHFERDLALRDGSFELEPVGERKTRIRLTTRYEIKLAPRFVWEPIERKVIHTLHSHVLEGMKREAKGETKAQPEPEYQPTPSAVPRNRQAAR